MVLFIAGFEIGLVLAWIYERTGSIWPAIIVHGLINGLTIIIAIGL